MVRRIIIISLAVLILIGNPTIAAAAGKSETAQHRVDEATQQRILSATVRITMIAKESSAAEPSYAISNGLGTLVQDGDAATIVTHDHWSRLAKKVRLVRIESAAGELLMDMTPERFYSLIRYRDGGTMVLATPPELTDCLKPVPAVAAEQPLHDGQELAIAFWQPEAVQQVTVEAVTIETVEAYDGNASIMMRSVNGKVVVQGNSGGGVFAGAKLVGNMWETMKIRQQVNGQPSGETSSTDLSRAARFTYDNEAQDELVNAFSAAPVRGGEF
jgi:hypothetical protein